MLEQKAPPTAMAGTTTELTSLTANSTRFKAPLPSGPIKYSRGKNTFDNQPEQRVANSWIEFWDALEKDRGDTKGEQYVCGPMKLGRHPDKDKYPHEANYRRKENSEDCVFLPFDFDHIPADMLAPLLDLLSDYSGCCYTTSSHSPENPRARAFIALSRHVTRGERTLVGLAFERYVLAKGVIGVKFDPAIYKTEQQCYLPLKNATFSDHNSKNALDVDELLACEYSSGASDSKQESPKQAGTQLTANARLSDEQLAIALLHIDAKDEQVWTDVAYSLARVYGEDGCEAWHIYSRQSDKYDFDECEKRFDRALREAADRPDGYGTKHLIELASTNPNWGRVSQKFEHWGELSSLGDLFDGSTQSEIALDPIEQVNQKFAWDSRNLLLYSRQSRMYIPESSFKTN